MAEIFDRLLLKPEVAERARLSLPTIWREQRAGRFPRFERLSAGRVGLRESRLAEWIAGRRDWSEAR
ncbi:MAG: helix-turn-helix transcriptional regulator [Sphingomonadaceae bacterium]